MTLKGHWAQVCWGEWVDGVKYGSCVLDDPLPRRGRVNVPARSRSASVEVRGIFPGAKVVRGHDWKWKDQDGMYMCYSLYTHVEVAQHAAVFVFMFMFMFMFMGNISFSGGKGNDGVVVNVTGWQNESAVSLLCTYRRIGRGREREREREREPTNLPPPLF